MSNNNSEYINSNVLYNEFSNNIYDDDENIDEILDIIKNTKSKSNFKNKLIDILYFLHKFPFILIIIEYLIGLIFIGLPILFVYLGKKTKYSNYYLICIIILLIITVLFLIIKINIDINNNIFIF